MKAEIVNTSDVEESLRLSQPSDLVFWVGAGIDYDPPRCLPLSKNLVTTLLQFILPDYASDFFERWQSCRSVLGPDIGSIPRMETLLDAIKTCETQLASDFSVMSGLRFFDEAPPNDNTRLLAEALSRGASIVTTNYSQAIEREAAKTPHGYRYRLIHDFDFPTFCQAVPDKPDQGSVYHIHGVSQDPGTMGITLPLISKRFSNTFKQVLAKWFASSKMIMVFAGYSGSDIYDVNRFFEEHYLSSDREESAATGVYLRHGTGCASPTQKEMALLLPFRKRLICSGRLSDLLIDPIGHVRAERTEKSGSCNPFEWKESFIKNATWTHDAEVKRELENLFVLALSDYFGLWNGRSNPSRI